MSRIGKKPIAVPSGVEVKIDGHHITVKGPKGTLEKDIRPELSVAMEEGQIVVSKIRGRRKFYTKSVVHNSYIR